MAGNDYTTAEGSLNKIRQDLVTLVENDVAGILGAATDTPADVVEGATARSFVSLLKGIKNYLKTLAGAVSGTKILVTADGTVTVNQGTAGAADWKITLDGEEVTSPGITIAQTPTVTVGAYSAGDAVGGLLTFAGAARVSGGGGVLAGVIIIDDAGQDAELELWLFDRTFTAMADNAAWAPSEGDLENLVGVISTEDSDQGWLAAGTPSAIDIRVMDRYDLNGTSLFGQLVTRGTPTFAAVDDVTVKVKLLQD